MKVRITKCSNTKAWYCNALGQTLTAYKIDDENRAWVSSSIVDKYDDFPVNSYGFGEGDGFINEDEYEIVK